MPPCCHAGVRCVRVRAAAPGGGALARRWHDRPVRGTGGTLDAVPPYVPLLGAVCSVQFGSAFADTIFRQAGPAGVALLRVAFTGAVLLVVARPSVRGRPRRDLATVAAYGLVLAAMNWSFYEALHRLPLGVAVTVEFTGPLALAVAGSRRLLDGLWVVLAGGGVALLALRGEQSGVRLAGVLLGLLAAALWASYILLAKRVTAVFAPLEALALGMAVGVLLVLPAGVLEGGAALGRPGVLAGCLGVALMSSVVPYSLELVALRRLPAAVFGLLMSLEPAVAALAGVLVLGQSLTLVLAVALLMVVAASVGATLSANRAVVPEPEA
jgi:inner membrane transporter RhtA